MGVADLAVELDVTDRSRVFQPDLARRYIYQPLHLYGMAKIKRVVSRIPRDSGVSATANRVLNGNTRTISRP